MNSDQSGLSRFANLHFWKLALQVADGVYQSTELRSNHARARVDEEVAHERGGDYEEGEEQYRRHHPQLIVCNVLRHGENSRCEDADIPRRDKRIYKWVLGHTDFNSLLPTQVSSLDKSDLSRIATRPPPLPDDDENGYNGEDLAGEAGGIVSVEWEKRIAPYRSNPDVEN